MERTLSHWRSHHISLPISIRMQKINRFSLQESEKKILGDNLTLLFKYTSHVPVWTTKSKIKVKKSL